MSSSLRPSNRGRMRFTPIRRAMVPSVASTRVATTIRTKAVRMASGPPRISSTAIQAASTRPIAV